MYQRAISQVRPCGRNRWWHEINLYGEATLTVAFQPFFDLSFFPVRAEQAEDLKDVQAVEQDADTPADGGPQGPQSVRRPDEVKSDEDSNNEIGVDSDFKILDTFSNIE